MNGQEARKLLAVFLGVALRDDLLTERQIRDVIADHVDKARGEDTVVAWDGSSRQLTAEDLAERLLGAEE